VNITTDDLDAAVAAGVVPASQADALRSFVANRASAPVPYGMEDERFRFMRGFNDFFFAVGVVLLGSAMIYYLGDAASARGADHPALPVLIWAAGAVITWALSELLIRRMRLVLPGILLAGLFLIFVFMATPAIDILYYFQIPPQAGSHSVLAQFRGITLAAFPLKALVATAALVLFYARFRLPFTLLLIAGSLVVGVMATTALFLPPDVSGSYSDAVILLICGLAIFAVAMRFDLSDRLRVTRRADCAFWLHLMAAPLIVHSLVSTIFFSAGPFGISVRPMSSQLGSTQRLERVTPDIAGTTITTILIVIIVLTLIAIIIDRRALLISALAYLGAIVGYAVTHAVGKDTNVFFATLLILGILVLTLGIGWRWLRGLVLRILPRAVVNRLPPVTIGT
jgi:hypothetical protein